MCGVDAGGARTSFIKSQLNRALADRSGSLATRRASREFRRYFRWFRDWLSEADKKRSRTSCGNWRFASAGTDSQVIQ